MSKAFVFSDDSHEYDVTFVLNELEELVINNINLDGTVVYRIEHGIDNDVSPVSKLKALYYLKRKDVITFSRRKNINNQIFIYIVTPQQPLFDKTYKRYKAHSQSEHIIKNDWQWLNEKEGEYQFGKITISFGRKRKNFWVTLMNLWEKDKYVQTQVLAARAHVTSPRARTEIYAINKKLKEKIGYSFVSEKQGGYQLVECMHGT